MISFLQIMGGLALFLYGVRMLSMGMEKLAGNQLQQWLDRMTSRPIKGAFFGAIATALIQSSSLLMVTMMGLINANLLTLEQAVGVMMGQEIGTTLTAQIVAFKIGDLCFLFVALGFALIEFAPRRAWQKYGEIILGFGILFLGMRLMSGALEALAEMPVARGWLAAVGDNSLLGVLAGAIATPIIQSSSAITGLVVAMGISQVITLPGAIAVILGANIGTCLTGLIASIRLASTARRGSIAQIIINVAGVALFLPFVSPFATLMASTSPSLPRQIANAHTVFNVAVSIILFPFVRQIARTSEWLVPASAEEKKPRLTKFIDRKLYRLPSIALAEATRELNRIGETTVDMVSLSHQALVENDMEAVERVLMLESEFMDPICAVLEDFINTLTQSNLSENQQGRALQLKGLITDMERVGDLAENLVQAAQEKVDRGVTFSSEAMTELRHLFRHAHRTYALAVQALRDGDPNAAQMACRQEDELDELYWAARQAHIDRLDVGVCTAEADVIFIESLRNLERIGDHAENLGISVLRSQR